MARLDCFGVMLLVIYFLTMIVPDRMIGSGMKMKDCKDVLNLH